MKTLIATLLLLIGLSLDASAADFAKIRRDVEASQGAVTSPGAACNRADEKFCDFLVKFTADADFHARRSKVSKMFALKTPSSYRAMVVTDGHDSGYNQKWEIVGADRVKLVCGFADAPADYSFLFTRTSGEWHLVDRVTEDF